jgi:hypothetical protein
MWSWNHWEFRLLLFVLFTPVACNLVAATNRNPRASSKSPAQYDLSGVWAGSSITSCTPFRMTGPLRCGSKADIKLTLIQKPAATITGVYASVRPTAGNAFEQTGRIVDVRVNGATSLWLRVPIRDHSSCLFNSNFSGEEMEGSYLCFNNALCGKRPLDSVAELLDRMALNEVEIEIQTALQPRTRNYPPTTPCDSASDESRRRDDRGRTDLRPWNQCRRTTRAAYIVDAKTPEARPGVGTAERASRKSQSKA